MIQHEQPEHNPAQTGRHARADEDQLHRAGCAEEHPFPDPQWKSGEVISFDLRDPDHCAFLFGDSGPAVNKMALEHKATGIAVITRVDRESNTIWFSPPQVVD